MQASFPWVSSAAELPTKQLRRIADAGYVDNYGGFVIAAWLEQNREWLKANTSGILVVQIRDSEFGAANRNLAMSRKSDAASRGCSLRRSRARRRPGAGSCTSVTTTA
jgi:hypothetical protein